MNTIDNIKVYDMAVEVLGSDIVVPFEECYTFEKEEIIDGIVFTEEDLKDFNNEVLGYTSYIELSDKPDTDYVQAAIVDPDNKIALFTIYEGDMEAYLKKEIVRF